MQANGRHGTGARALKESSHGCSWLQDMDDAIRGSPNAVDTHGLFARASCVKEPLFFRTLTPCQGHRVR